MDKSLDDVRKNFDSTNYKEVVKQINKLLDEESTVKKISENHLQKLYQYRAAALTHLGEDDKSLNPLVIAHKYPDIYQFKNYEIESTIQLKYGDALLQDCDVMINSITEERDLSLCPERSLSRDLHDMGMDISEQSFNKNIIQSPATAKWPNTIHIPCIKNVNNDFNLNRRRFKRQVRNILLQASHKNYNKILIPPIGVETVDDYNNNESKLDIIGLIVDEVLSTLRYVEEKNVELEIIFVSLHLTTYNIFKEVLDQRNNLPKKKVKIKEEQKAQTETNIAKFLHSINTNNENYENQLAENLAEYLDADFPILLKGEPGSGKTYLAKKIHSYSSRSNAPFKYLNCATLTGNTLEATLFGAEKGAWTGLEKEKKALLSQVDDGILFLDEIHSLEPTQQEKLLHVVESGEYRKYNSTQYQEAGNFRLICATNENIKEQINEGLFKKDFYDRINQIELTIPPLRGRIEDIPILSQSILNKLTRERSKNQSIEPFKVGDEVAEFLKDHDWPENIRGLEQFLEKAEYKCFNKQIEFLPENFPKLPRKSIWLRTSKAGADDFVELIGKILEAYCKKHFDEVDKLDRKQVSFIEKIIKPIIVKHYFGKADFKRKKNKGSKLLSIETRYDRDSSKNKIDNYLNKYNDAKREIEELLN